ncbi:MAG: hypothetical protein ACKO40_02480 [Planctomycetaceae bacterium]
MRHAATAGRLRDTATGVFEPLERAIGTAAVVAGAAAAAAGSVLALRRIAGGFGPADLGLAWLVAASGIMLVAAADAAARRGAGLAGPLAARVGMLVGVAAVTLPPRSGDWTSLTALLAAGMVAGLPVPRRAARRPAMPSRPPRSPSHRDEPADTRLRAPRQPDVPGRLLQRLERYETADGRDSLRGRVCLAVAAGSRTTHAHVGFCPAFATTPTVAVSTEYDGVEAVVTAAEVLPWGIRVECRLAEPADEDLEIPVDVAVQATR